MRLVEGQQYFINRITFVGNTTTHDNVIRRELRLVEDGVFNTEALKYSVRRLNQLGYFKPLEAGKDIAVDKTPGETNKVDVKLKLEEQNRNQISFGAGVSEFEGFFGQASFQTSNFLGRGESLTVSLSAGSRAQNYTLAFTEPFLFDRNMTGSVNLYRNDVRYIGQFTQRSTGGVVGFGLSARRLHAAVHQLQLRAGPRHRDQRRSTPIRWCSRATRSCAIRCSSARNGERIISKVTPSIVHNTVDQPIFPNQGVRYTASIDLAGLGGNTSFYKPSLEGIWYWRQNARMSLGMRALVEYIHSYRGLAGAADLPEALPRRRIFRPRVRHPEHRPAGSGHRPRARRQQEPAVQHRAELQHHEPVPDHPVLRRRAGARRGAALRVEGNATRARRAARCRSSSTPPSTRAVLEPSATATRQRREVSAFKTSTGVEVRLFMPVINVPFRLIFAYNPQRAGVLDNTLQPQKAFQFRFAVGTTF